MTIIDGKATAAEIKKQIAEKVETLVKAGLKQPHLAAILVGHDGGSETYVKTKCWPANRVVSSRHSSAMKMT